MRLSDDTLEFKDLINKTAKALNISQEYIEKDYWIYLVLKEIFKDNKNGYVFKGGTSLSKCFKLINRFSEDIDISYSSSYKNLTVGEARRKFQGIVGAIQRTGLVIENLENLRSKRYFNQFLCPYETVFKSDAVASSVVLELAAQTPSFPSQTKVFSSYIGDYLESINRPDLISKYELEPFSLQVQSLERTLVDKTFALCDYYLTDSYEKHSRHVYDIAKLLTAVNLNNELVKLFKEVREYRQNMSVCVSAREGVKLHQVMSAIIDLKTYKKDFESITYQLLYEDCPYKKCEEVLTKLKDFLTSNDL